MKNLSMKNLIINTHDYIPAIGDRVFGIVHPYLTQVWIGPAGPLIIPKEKTCSGIIVRQMFNEMFLIKSDHDKLLACAIGYVYKPT